jgi:hypothetical protein
MTMCPTLLGFHTFTLCSTTCMSNSSDHFSYWIIIWSSSHSLDGGGRLYVPRSVSGRNHIPFLGALSQVCKLRERLQIAAMIHTSQVCKLENVSHSFIHQHSSTHKKQSKCLASSLHSARNLCPWVSTIPFPETLSIPSKLKGLYLWNASTK